MRIDVVAWGLLLTVPVVFGGCQQEGITPPSGPAPEADLLATCNLDTDYLRDGNVGWDGIPALTNPILVSAESRPENAYLDDEDRVVGIVVEGEALAIPHNVLRLHEIVNLDFSDIRLAVTYCPLTGSSMVFDREVVDGDPFGVSGLLWKNNLVMFNRRTEQSLWPQMLSQARCGPEKGTFLPRYPAVEMTWKEWKRLHPGTRVPSSESSLGRDWTHNPYASYESLSNDRFLFDDAMPPLDRRRPIKERVLGIPRGESGGVAFPFGVLDDAGPRAAIHATVPGELGEEEIVVFWDGEARSAVAYRPRIDDRSLRFRVEAGEIRDEETGTTWNLLGEAFDGEFHGERLEPVGRAFVAFWGAWAAFRPETGLWEG